MTNEQNNHGSHERWDELAVGYAMSALEPDELDQFIRHLVARCPQCSQSVADSDDVGAAMNSLLTMTEPRAGHRSDVLAAAFAARPPVPQTTADLELTIADFGDRPLRSMPIEAGPRLTSVPTDPSVDVPSIATPVVAAPSTSTPASERSPALTGPRHLAPGAESDDAPLDGADGSATDELSARRNRKAGRFASRTGRILVAAASAVAILVLSVTTIAALHSRDNAQNVADRQQSVVNSILAGGAGRVVPLHNVNGNNGAAIVVARDNSVSVVPTGINANAKSSTYVLWGIASTTSEPVALGVFDVNAGQVAATQVGTNAGGYSSYHNFAISVEPGRTAPAAPSKIVSAGQA